ncbi:hypothetical protein V1477_008540 [Vespula maculifrons]|uniref:Uncharacterized protein n=1 Tax=Vespula maculifrons TaxID=7453 RepID=A0ABD2CDB0_VESMC
MELRKNISLMEDTHLTRPEHHICIYAPYTHLPPPVQLKTYSLRISSLLQAAIAKQKVVDRDKILLLDDRRVRPWHNILSSSLLRHYVVLLPMSSLLDVFRPAPASLIPVHIY